jgi:hypothetical protein
MLLSTMFVNDQSFTDSQIAEFHFQDWSSTASTKSSFVYNRKAGNVVEEVSKGLPARAMRTRMCF